MTDTFVCPLCKTEYAWSGNNSGLLFFRYGVDENPMPVCKGCEAEGERLNHESYLAWGATDEGIRARIRRVEEHIEVILHAHGRPPFNLEVYKTFEAAWGPPIAAGMSREGDL